MYCTCRKSTVLVHVHVGNPSFDCGPKVVGTLCQETVVVFTLLILTCRGNFQNAISSKCVLQSHNTCTCSVRILVHVHVHACSFPERGNGTGEPMVRTVCWQCWQCFSCVCML